MTGANSLSEPCCLKQRKNKALKSRAGLTEPIEVARSESFEGRERESKSIAFYGPMEVCQTPHEDKLYGF